MANFFAIVDPDPERRSHVVKRILPLLPPVEGLTINSCTKGNFHASWAAHPCTPISVVADTDEVAIIWGEAITQAESSRIDATSLRNLFNKFPTQSLPPFDGYYAAVIHHPHVGLTVAADLLGFFPIYYYTHNEIALVASSPELFRYHPLFEVKFNPAGLVGILLTNGLVNGQTLWQGIKRLDAGHSLIWQPTKSPIEVKQYEIQGSSQHDPYRELSFSEHLNILEQALDQTLKRHVQDEEKNYSLLLSGGLDSRMLAGFLHRQGIKPKALTLGKPSDIEMQCAVPVARTLGLEHHAVRTKLELYPVYADLLSKWEHLSSGFNGVVMGWNVCSNLSKLAPRFIAGFSIDVAAGGPLPVTHPTEELCFEIFFNRGVNNWGISPDLLNKFLDRQVFENLVQETLSHIRHVYEEYSDLESRRSWWFELFHRQRFHVGATAWRLSFGAWPILPILDLQLLKTTSVLPLGTMNNRQAQKQLVCTRFPQLAQLPLDRNAFDVEPLLPSKNRQRLARLLRLQCKWRHWQQKLGIDRRYYYQIFDINNRGWMAVRRQAEPYRPLVRHLFREDVFNELLPKPDVPILCQTDAIIEASSRKALLGFLLWSRDHL